MAVRILPFPVSRSDLAKLDELQRKHSAAIDAGDLLTVFYSNLHFHRALFGLCGNACLIETIEQLAQKVYGIRSYANAFPDALDRGVEGDDLAIDAAFADAAGDQLGDLRPEIQDQDTVVVELVGLAIGCHRPYYPSQG